MFDGAAPLAASGGFAALGLRPGILLGSSPERPVDSLGRLDRWEAGLLSALTPASVPSFKRFRRQADTIRSEAERLAGLPEETFLQAVSALKRCRRSEGGSSGLYQQAFAMVCVLCERLLGLVPHDEQLYAGWLILNGLVAEMATGEGKTLACAFPAAAAALIGTPVHVVTVNDYLVKRDVDLLGPVYAALGLSVGAITETSSPVEREQAYAAQVTYLSNKQLVFDYLRDQQVSASRRNSLRERMEPLVSLSAGRRMQRGLCFAIVDEADSALIDDAKTPFVLSRPVAEARNAPEYTVALGVARRLQQTEHFVVGSEGVRLTDSGNDRLAELTEALPSRWKNSRFRRETIEQALAALHYYVRDKHYIVREGRVVLIDENTGRPMPDRMLSGGLHQMVQAKEQSPVTQPNRTLARISYQRFFCKYISLSGITGTGWEVRGELRSVYRVRVKKVPVHRPRRATNKRVRLFPSAAEKYEALLDTVRCVHGEGRPVLIGTRSVAESEQIQRLLGGAELPSQLLNANQDARESEIVATAGGLGQIVVATNMAGRGTDIPLGEGVSEIGGLHVISAHLNDSARIDRQLFGRCGRQGDPGSFEAILSLEDDIFAQVYPAPVVNAIRRLAKRRKRLWRFLAPSFASFTQWIRSHELRRVRGAVRRADEHLDDLLAFAPVKE